MKKDTHPLDELVTVAEIASQLGITTREVQRLIDRGHFPSARKLGAGATSAYVIVRSDLDAYLKKREAQSKVKSAMPSKG